MQSKGLRRDKAILNKVYIDIKNKCMEYLNDKRMFKKQWILKDLSMEVFADSIRWDYIAEWIEKDGDCELAPLAEAFFKSRTIKDERQKLLPIGSEDSKALSRESIAEKVPGKFVASGHGKKTVGYASVTFANGALHLERLKTRKALSIGLTKSADKLQCQIDRQRAPLNAAGSL